MVYIYLLCKCYKFTNLKTMHRVPRIPKILFASLVAALLIIACDYSYFDDFPGYKPGPTFSIPLLNGSLSIQDLLPDGDFNYLDIDEDNFITFVAQTASSSETANKLLFLSDQHMAFNQQISLGHSQKTTAQTDTLIQIVHMAGFDFNIGEKLDSLLFMEGIFKLSVQEPQLSLDDYDVSICVTIPKARDENGKAITFFTSLNDSIVFSLDEYHFEFYNTENSYNHFDIIYSIDIKGMGDPKEYDMLFEQSFQELEFVGLYGDIIALEFEMQADTMYIDFYNNWEEGTVNFVEPSVLLKTENTFGFLTYVYLDTIQAQNRNQKVDIITYEPVSITPWIINNASYPGHSATTILNLDRETSNFDDFINLPPEKIIYSMRANLFSNQTTQGFILHDSKIDFKSELKLPLHGSISNYVLLDSLKIAPGEIAENIEKLELFISVANSFPLDVSFQMIFLDRNDETLFYLFDDVHTAQIIASAEVDPNGQVIEQTIKETVVTLSQEKIKKLKRTKRALLRVKFETAEAGEIPVKIYTHQSVDMSMHMQVELSFSL